MRKTVATLAAGALILGGAAVATAQTDTEPVDGDAVVGVHHPGTRIESFLSEMVDEGVISQDQADQLLAELASRAEERIARRAELRAAFEGAWNDGVLTLAEIEELGADWLLSDDGPFAEALEDGELTRAEFDAIRAELSGPRHHRGWRGFGGTDRDAALTGDA